MTDQDPMPNRLEIATRIYASEAGLTAHYETMRLTFLGFVITFSAAVLLLYDEAPGAVGKGALGLFLMFFSLISSFSMWRFCHAAKFHWRLTAKMRQIIAKNDEKVFSKYAEISADHTKNKIFARLKTDDIWVLFTLFVPLISASILLAA
ncbi:MAG: hypothetical protein AAF675_17075 [Pseudomonadota bacterium]